jgi:iron complex outermembrane recepter protein
LFAAVSVGALSVGAARAQQAGNSAQPLPPVEVTAKKSKTTKHKREAGAKQTTSPANVNSQNNSSVTTSSAITAGGTGASAVTPTYHTENANLGPLGNKSILDTPTSITVIPQELILNQQDHTVNDLLHFLPSVEIRDQQGFEVSRPQSRGFQGSIVQNTRIDGLNAIGTTAIPAENLAGIQVLNGLAGSLYGPETPAGVFNYVLKRPTDTPMASFTEGFASDGTFTEQFDASGRSGNVGYRFNIVRGDGQSYVPESSTGRTLFSSALDFHIDEDTVLETDFSHYNAQAYGLPGSIVYDGASSSSSNKSTILPSAVDPTKMGYGQPSAGTDLTSDTGIIKLKHQFNDQWSMEIGGLYENAIRNLFGITNTMTNNNGDFTVTKNFTAVPHFTIASNTASLNGHVDILGFMNDVTIGTNGFVNGQYSYGNSIAVPLGSSTLANLVVFLPSTSIPATGGEYKSAELDEQAIILADTFHFNKQWAVQAVLNTSFLSSKSYGVNVNVTSSDSANGVLSPTVSLIYKPIAHVLCDICQQCRTVRSGPGGHSQCQSAPGAISR